MRDPRSAWIAARGSAALVAVLLAGCAGPAAAPFFAGIDDLPLMPGLSEQPGERSSFDTAEGRIEARGAAGPARAADVLRFYADTLPQLGWQPADDGGYARGAERLRLDLAPAPEDPGLLLLRILITPG
jgi:hypothetical protein